MSNDDTEPNRPNFQPLHDWVLLREVPKTRTAGGLHVPDVLQTGRDGEPNEAIVMRVGPGSETETGHRRTMPVKEGDRIFIFFPPSQAPAKIDIDGEAYLLVNARVICGVIEPPEPKLTEFTAWLTATVAAVTDEGFRIVKCEVPRCYNVEFDGQPGSTAFGFSEDDPKDEDLVRSRLKALGVVTK